MSIATAQPSTRDGRWTAEPGFGVYVHIPFCRHRCHYCDFNTYEGLNALFDPYVDAVVREIQREPEPRVATSVFFGGGTPTLLAPTRLGRVLEAIDMRFGLAPDAEVTVEANPDTADLSKLEQLRAAGFNRISIGAQSLVPSVLSGLGRTHDPDRPLAALADARKAGFDDVNLDLIYGSPWESEDDWLTSLKGVIAAAPDHISAYALTIEEGTPLATLIASDRCPDVDPDIQATRHGVASELLAAAGYSRYEISNWARPGRASRHNVLYWSGGNYAGIGAGAHAHRDGRRSWSLRLPRDFIAAAESGATTEAGAEELAPERRAAEALVLGLRLRSGLRWERFCGRYSAEALTTGVVSLLEAGLLESVDGWLRIPDELTLLTGDISSRLL